MFLADWPFHNLSQPTRGIVETIFNLILVWFVIHVECLYRILGLGFNFLSEPNLEWSAARRQDCDARGGRPDPDSPEP